MMGGFENLSSSGDQAPQRGDWDYEWPGPSEVQMAAYNEARRGLDSIKENLSNMGSEKLHRAMVGVLYDAGAGLDDVFDVLAESTLLMRQGTPEQAAMFDAYKQEFYRRNVSQEGGGV